MFLKKTKGLKRVALLMGASLLLTPCTVFARGDLCDYDKVRELYLAKAHRAEVTAETRPERPTLNSAIDNESIRSNDYTHFVEADEKHFLTITCEEDEQTVFGHEEALGLSACKVYEVEAYIRNDAALCLEHLPAECDKTLQDVRVRAAHPDILYKGAFSCVAFEITCANGAVARTVDYIEVTGLDEVYLSVVPGSIVIETDGLTNGMQLNEEEFFSEEGASVGYYSLDTGIPAGFAIRVRFQVQT